MADQLTVTDGPLTLLEDLAEGRVYTLVAKIEGALARASSAELGPAVNALYARTLAAAQTDPALAALAQVREGAPEGISLDLSINRHAYNATAAEFGLNLQLVYWQSDGAPTRREPALEALTAAIDAATAGPDPCVREMLHAALAARLQHDLGLPVLRNAARPVSAAGGPVLIFQDGPQVADDSTLGLVLYIARPALEIFVPGQDAAQLDAILQAAIASVRAMDRLGGIALDVCEGETDPDVLRELYAGPLLGARLEIEAYFMTPHGNPYVSADRMRMATRIAPVRDRGTDIRCPRCGRKNGSTIIPGGRHQIVCKRCHATIDFETWPDEYEEIAAAAAEPVIVSRTTAPATPGHPTSRPQAALSKG